MHILRTTITLAAFGLAACSSKRDSDSNSALARDTALTADLKAASDTTGLGEAADIAMRDIPDSTLPMPPSRPMTVSPGREPTMRTGNAPDTRRTGSTPSTPAPASPAPVAPSTTVHPTTPHPTPVPVQPPPVRPSPAPPVQSPSSSASADAGEYPTPACAAPAAEDQRRCLLAYLAQSDRVLNQTYQARIRQLEADAGTAPGAPEPESVQRLRTAQRAWLVYRDTECRNRNRGREGALWAPVRARCLGEFSQVRAAELARPQ